VVGVAPGVRLWSVKVFDGFDSSPWSAILAGMDYIAAHADKISVVNCSFGSNGGPGSPVLALHQAVRNMVSLGIVVVGAAGNNQNDIAGNNLTFDADDDPQNDDVVPASFLEVMAVSAMDPTNDLFASFSDFNFVPRSTNYVLSPGN